MVLLIFSFCRPSNGGAILGVRDEVAAIKSSLAEAFVISAKAAGRVYTNKQGLAIAGNYLALVDDENIIELGPSVLAADLIWRCFESVLDKKSSSRDEIAIWFAAGMMHAKIFREMDINGLTRLQRNLIEDLFLRQVRSVVKYRAAINNG